MLDCSVVSESEEMLIRETARFREDGRWILAGSLTPDSVCDEITRFQPWGVDVSRGIEREPRMKDRALMQQFRDAVRDATA